MIGLLALAAAAAAQPQTVLTIDPKHRLVEGVASDGTTIWVSSILDRQILACREDLPDAGDAARAAASVRDRLGPAAASGCGSPPIARRACPAIKPCERGALIALDKRGRIQTRIAPGVGAFHPGDVSASDGQRVRQRQPERHGVPPSAERPRR